MTVLAGKGRRIKSALDGDPSALEELRMEDGRIPTKATLKAMLQVEEGNTLKAKSGRDILNNQAGVSDG